MKSNNDYEIFFLVESGIGNAIEVLYAVEYCLHNKIKTGIYLNKISASFIAYIRSCYGEDVVVSNIDNISTKNLVQSFTYQDSHKIVYDNYFYVMANVHSTKYMSETEQYLSIVRSLFPSSYNEIVLTRLQENYSDKVINANPDNKFVLYPGCSSISPAKRWPYYLDLVKLLGEDKVIVLGGDDDLNFEYSYYYPKWITSIFPRPVLHRIQFYNFVKSLGLLKKHSHNDKIETEAYSFFNYFSWPELVAVLKRARGFVGNDGGITHLAGACGQSGYSIFGPSSVNKNKPINYQIKPVSRSYDCQPCQFHTKGHILTTKSIVCPYQVRCLYNIHADEIFDSIQAELK